MKRCVKMLLNCGKQKDFLSSYVKEHAQANNLEGVAQRADTTQIAISVCGKSEAVDVFIDAIHEASAKYQLTDITLEPFFKMRDYRGVFRVIE